MIWGMVQLIAMGSGLMASGCSSEKINVVNQIQVSVQDSGSLVVDNSVSRKLQVEDPSCFESGHGGFLFFFAYAGDRPCSGGKSTRHGAQLGEDFSVDDPTVVVQKYFFSRFSGPKRVFIELMKEVKGRIDMVTCWLPMENC
jgi:hypothetical protein